MLSNTDVIQIGIPRTFFGVGAINKIGDAIKDFGAEKVLVVTDKGLVAAGVADEALNAIKAAGLEVDVFDGAGREAPVSMIQELVKLIRDNGYGLLVAVGGGSTMDTTKTAGHLALNPELSVDDLLKAKPFKRNLPIIAVPTTAGTGSEWSAWAVIHNDVADGVHYPYPTPNNYPDVVILDPAMTTKVPPKITADTGMDALAHAVEAYTSPNASIVSDMFATFAIKTVAKSLRQAYAKGGVNLDDRYNLSIAASTAMLAMSLTGPGIAHLMNETLGEMAGLAHGRATGLLLPWVMEFNLMTCPRRFADIAELMGERTCGLSDIEAGEKAVAAVRRLMSDLGMPQTLTAVGVGQDKIPELATELVETRGPVIKMAACREMSLEEATALYQRIL
jgi:alcohol dehydrogenase class IV